jgi:hypothetical protein
VAATDPAPAVELTPPASEPAPPCAPVLAKMLSSPPPALEELEEEEDGVELPAAPGCPASPPAELAPSPGNPALGKPPPPTLGNPADALALAPPPGVGMPVDPA